MIEDRGNTLQQHMVHIRNAELYREDTEVLHLWILIGQMRDTLSGISSYYRGTRKLAGMCEITHENCKIDWGNSDSDSVGFEWVEEGERASMGVIPSIP
jgi:hypothetical protein